MSKYLVHSINSYQGTLNGGFDSCCLLPGNNVIVLLEALSLRKKPIYLFIPNAYFVNKYHLF